MKKVSSIIIFALIFQLLSAQNDLSEIDRIFTIKHDFSMISRGDNMPNFSQSKDSANFFLISLHKNIPIDKFKEKTGFDDAKINSIISFFESKNWLHHIGGKPKPTIFIADREDGKALFDFAKPISIEIEKAIKSELPQVKALFSTTDISKLDSFDQWSFFILSNVLMDNWQINDIESHFLKAAERPLRHGKNYYYAYLEMTDKNRESFGIYGNMTMTKDGVTRAIYGNNRYNIRNSNPTFSKRLSSADNKVFNQMAKSFLPTLIDILEKQKPYIDSVYAKLGYKDEISFNEFFIWWYHFIYTQVTDNLAKEGIIQMPEDGNFYYEIIYQ